MKPNHVKIWKCLLALCLALVLTPSVFAVDLQVTGITGTYAEANGIYTLQSDLKNEHSYWVLSGTAYNIHYAIWTDGTSSSPYWYIDNDYVDDVGLFYSKNSETPTSPLLVTSWYDDLATGGVNVSVLEYSAFPEINITGNGTTISSGGSTPSLLDYTKFGAADITGATIARTFTIQNSGAQALSVGAITISGTNASDFNIATSPASSVAASGSTTFVITFDPSAIGDRNATVSIANSDPDENPYTFAISGYGYTPADLVVAGITGPADANGTYIHQGVLNDFQYWKHSTLDYIIYHQSSGTVQQWIIDNNTVAVGDGMLFISNSAEPTPAGITTWDVSSYVISSVYYTAAGNPTISQTTAVPEINVKVGQFTLADGNTAIHFYDNTNFGTLNVSSDTRTRTFTIENNGTAPLTLSGTSPYVTITGIDAADFSVTTAPASSVAASGTTTFVVTFDPSTVGTKTATLNIANNDDDEGSYHFNIQGDAITPKSLVVSNITTPSEANGTYTYQGISNEFQYWKHSSGSYYIYNYRANSLNDATWYIDTDMDATAYEYKSISGGDKVSPLSSSWSPTSGNAGTPIIVYAEPEINVTGNSVSIADGDATPSIYDFSDFGWITSGSITRTYTIQNLGTETLTLTGSSPYVVIGGTDASQFSIVTSPSTTIAAGASTTFQVKFTPTTSSGMQTATLSIANTDADENPYNFFIQGGLAVSTVVTTQSVSSIGTTTATGNGNVTTLGSPDPTAYGVCWNTTGTPTTSDSKVDNGAVSVTGAFTASMTSLTTNTTYHVRAYATNTAGTSYGNEVTFTTSGIAPIVTTQAVTSINTTTATGNGNINELGVPSPTAYGVCWNTTGTPTTSDSKVDNGAVSVTGAFTASIIGLTEGTTYYVRAFATNSAGTSYGDDVNFTTLSTPVITWANPSDIVYGTKLSATQLNATASVLGTYTYTPPLETKLNAGAMQNLTVDFTPTDLVNYVATSKIVTIDVSKATPVITWANPENVKAGTPLSATQLNATADVAGSFVYTPALGAVLSTGADQSLLVAFTPTDTLNYSNETKTVLITVNPTVGINKAKNIAFRVYLNPTVDLLRIDGLTERAVLTITDLNGRVFMNEEIENNQSVSTSSLPSGTYLANILTKGNSHAIMFIKK